VLVRLKAEVAGRMGAAEAGAVDRMRHLDDRPPEEEEVGKAVAGGA
jgi:hypothetical protein